MEQTQEMVRVRKEKGLAIASTKKVRREGKFWIVPSQTRDAEYKVELKLTGATCTCPDFQKHGMRCKHVWAVEYTIEKTINAEWLHYNNPDQTHNVFAELVCMHEGAE